ncbi:MAG: fibronectin type III domain-containing protein [Candidatus Gracilibacteria bacterium]|nr:fibronectin type III domain-containing protein [Candidatus Gracilibacteria bacterium]
MKKFLTYLLAITAVFTLAAPAFAQLQTTPDLDVEGVKVTAMNGSVKVEWDPVPYTDGTLKGYVVWYDTSAAAANGDSYANKAPATGDLGNVTSHIVTGLENGKTYYFAVTAVDTNGVESQNWSIPANVSAIPSADAKTPEDSTPPQVVKATALNKEEVKVEFSEAIVLPSTNPENSFVVQNTDTFEDLAVKGAELDKEDSAGKTVVLTTDSQEKNANYKLTVGIDVEDKSGNPIRSDTSATAPFVGTDAEKAEVDTAGPEVVSIEVVDNSHLMIGFNESVVLGIDPTKNFTIAEKATPANVLEIKEVILGKNSDGVEDASVIVATGVHKNVDYVVTVAEIKDATGNEVNTEKSTIEFKGLVPAVGGDEVEIDVTPPKDVASFLAKKIFEAEKWNVTLTWAIPAENVGDVVEQLIYKSLDKGEEYAKETSLEPDVKSYEMEGLDAGEYWFKITQKDATGNESAGKIVKVILAETGPGVVGLVLASAVIGRIVTKKKR